ncbi:MAG: hypothetical protein ACPGPF_05310 [Pontibacterium sp.]
MTKVEHENGYIHIYAIAVCDGCLQAFDVVDSDYYLSMFDKEE